MLRVPRPPTARVPQTPRSILRKLKPLVGGAFTLKFVSCWPGFIDGFPSPEEAFALRKLFARVMRLGKLQSIATIGADVLDAYVVRHLGTLAAFTAMLPALYSGATDSESTEYAVTCLHLLVNVGLACRDAVVALRKVTVCGGLSDRLIELHDGFEATATNAAKANDGATFILDNVTIMVPCQPPKPLIRSMHLTVAAGQNVLVSGPNGSGE
jgi:ABC-type uncharacterized transport system fused permease/ATPase subunit